MSIGKSSYFICNPHSIRAALLNRPNDVEKIISPVKPSDAWKEVLHLARVNKISVGSGGFERQSGVHGKVREKGREKNREKSGRTSEAGAWIKPIRERDFGDIFVKKEKGLWVILDCIQDPHNIGAIFRSASFFGISGIALTEDRTTGLTGTVLDIASGGVETVPFCIIKNLKRSLDELKKMDFWTLGASEHAPQPLQQFYLDRSWVLVLGNEEKGLRRLTMENVDALCSIPSVISRENGIKSGEPGKANDALRGGSRVSSQNCTVSSLNVSVAAGVLFSHFMGV